MCMGSNEQPLGKLFKVRGSTVTTKNLSALAWAVLHAVHKLLTIASSLHVAVLTYNVKYCFVGFFMMTLACVLNLQYGYVRLLLVPDYKTFLRNMQCHIV